MANILNTHDFTKDPLPRGPRGAFSKHTVPITHIVVHYTWTRLTDTWDMRRVAKLHTNSNGWNGPGYHYLIRIDGSFEFGRPEWAQGAHVRNANNGKIGVAFEGGRLNDNNGHNTMTAAQRKTMHWLISHLKKKYPNAKVNGHRDHVATQCPGFDAAAWWQHKKPKPGDVAAPATVNPTPLEGWLQRIVRALFFWR
jgi:N-acetylmuramoyl-L-alanine amidase